MDRHETLREPIQDDIDSESPPKSICGGRIERNGRSGGVSESSWRHLRPSSGPLGPFRRPLGAIMDRHETPRERIQNELHSDSPPKSIHGGCIERNGSSGGVLEASWRHLRPL